MNWSTILKTTVFGSLVLMGSAAIAEKDEVTSKIIGADGNTIGAVKLQQGSGGVLMTVELDKDCLLYTSPSPRDQRGSRMPSSA